MGRLDRLAAAAARRVEASGASDQASIRRFRRNCRGVRSDPPTVRLTDRDNVVASTGIGTLLRMRRPGPFRIPQNGPPGIGEALPPAARAAAQSASIL